MPSQSPIKSDCIIETSLATRLDADLLKDTTIIFHFNHARPLWEDSKIKKKGDMKAPQLDRMKLA